MPPDQPPEQPAAPPQPLPTAPPIPVQQRLTPSTVPGEPPFFRTPPIAQAQQPPTSGASLLQNILSGISPISTAQAAERVDPPFLKIPGAELGGSAAGMSRSPVPPSSIGVQPQLPPRPAGGASGMQSQVESMVGAAGTHPAGTATPTEPPREDAAKLVKPPSGGAGGAGIPPHPPGGPSPPAAPPPAGRPLPSVGVPASRIAVQNRRGIELLADAIRTAFWPKGWQERRMGREQAKATLREERGQSERAVNQAAAALEHFRGIGAGLGREFQEWLAGGKTGPLPDAMRLINDIEGAAALPKGDPLKPLADTLRRLYRKTRSDIESSLPDHDRFLEDYYRHMWVETAKGDPPQWGTFKAGTSASLKERTIPTIGEGLEAGLTPTHADPIENTLHYIQGMQKFLAYERAVQAGREMGYVTSEPTQTAYGENWVPLESRGGAKLYAEPGFAKIWNYYYGKGWRDPQGGNLYQRALHFANTVTAFKLGLSGYHAWNIAQEAAVAGIANAFGRLAAGDFRGALKDMGYSVTIAPKVAEQIARGGKLQRVYLDLDTGSNMDRTLVDYLTLAGMRFTGRGQEYRASAMDNFFTAFRRGKLKADMLAHARRIRGDPATEGPIRRGVFGAGRTVDAIASELSRAAHTISAPLFDTVIPRVKAAAAADELEAWIGAHPQATEQEILAQSRRIVNTIDDRFGEMVQDNLFWHPMLRKTFNLMATSIGWEFGSLRAYGGAAKDLMAGRPLSPRSRWALAFPMLAAISSAVYQYLKTGKPPGEDESGRLVPGGAIKDLAFPRTGGMTPEGMPERALLPGYEKDPIQWYKHLEGAYDFAKDGDMMNAVISGTQGVGSWVAGRLNPAGQMTSGLLTGKDFFGRQIRDSFYGPFRGYAGFVLQSYLPIPLTQENLRGTNIGTVERFAGVRPAPQIIQDPAREDIFKLKQRLNELKREYTGLFAHGRRTDTPEKELRRQGNLLKQEMQRTADKLRKAQSEFRASPRKPPPRGGVDVIDVAPPASVR
jgi:hypothetical protein